MHTSAKHGILTDYTTGEEIRPATAEEHSRSLSAGETGAFDLDGRAVFVAGGPEEATTYTAAIGLLSDVVAGDHCDVSVIENEVRSYREDSEGNEVPEYTLTDRVVMDAVETDVRVDADDKHLRIEEAADEILHRNGWVRVGAWEPSHNAAYATVERQS